MDYLGKKMLANKANSISSGLKNDLGFGKDQQDDGEASRLAKQDVAKEQAKRDKDAAKREALQAKRREAREGDREKMRAKYGIKGASGASRQQRAPEEEQEDKQEKKEGCSLM